MNDNPKISASKTFSPNSIFDLDQILEHAKNRTEALDQNGVFTQSIRIICEIDDSEFLPKVAKVVSQKSQVISLSEEEDDEPIIIASQSEENAEEITQAKEENIQEENIQEESKIVYIMDEQPSDENNFVDNHEQDDDFGVITPSTVKLPKRKKK